jgi:Type IV pili methyl-accepting chemotaxis transducer N-term
VESAHIWHSVCIFNNMNIATPSVSRRHLLRAGLGVVIACTASARTSQAFAQSATPSRQGAVTRASAATTTNLTMGDAIDRSGRQRMLSQRMGKAYVQWVNQTIADRSLKILRESIASFDAALVELERFAPDSDTRLSFAAQRKAWITLRALLERTPTKDGIPTVMSATDDVLTTAESATRALEKVAATSGARIVNLSGRQRMLSQRIARLFALDVSENSNRNASAIATAAQQFTTAMAEIEKWPQNTAQTSALIVLANSQWAFYTSAFSANGQPSQLARQAENVAKASENLLETMDKATAAYAKIVG